MMDAKQLHEKILYPVVRVRTEKAGGSGTIIYSAPNPENKEEYQSFVMTCHHVVSDAITYKKEFHPVLKKDVKVEHLSQVSVEIFDYVYLSKINSSNSYKADIIAYDEGHDIAILKLDSPKPCPYVAKLIPKDQIKDVKLFTPAFSSGCSLGHDPIFNDGRITYLSEMIDNKLYWMTNCSSIFGNSGGAVFLAETGEQVGITARISTIQLGFGVDVITWMGFSVAPQRFYEFFNEQELKFLYDSKDTYAKALDRRKKKAEKALLGMGQDQGVGNPDEEVSDKTEG
uniref:Putative trypsin-like peptidase domain containing protein n=1 Tax=viral metagenome TaxID=1070528 RepID=A0A6M3LH82_9ZZZZ